jgi:hypothetical protein
LPFSNKSVGLTTAPWTLVENRDEYDNGGDIFTSSTQHFLPVSSTPHAVQILFQNMFQSLYHSVRLELGIIPVNQIYADAVMYNRTILEVYVPPPPSAFNLPGSVDYATYTNISRQSSPNPNAVAQWQAHVNGTQKSDCVPILLYSRQVPRLKPMGSAITSVFVSTFAMLSVAWTIFSVIAGALAALYPGKFCNNPRPISC